MAVFLLLVAIVGGGLILWGITYRFRQAKAEKDPEEQFEKARLELFNYIRRSSTAIPKIDIITGLEIDPHYFKKLVKSLIDDGFITESSHSVKITKFGEQYYDKFIYTSR